jgi:hypothetical protein
VGARPAAVPAHPDTEKERNKCAKFEALLGQSPVNLTELEKASWSGVPAKYRSR